MKTILMIRADVSVFKILNIFLTVIDMTVLRSRVDGRSGW